MTTSDVRLLDLDVVLPPTETPIDTDIDRHPKTKVESKLKRFV